MVAWWRCGRSLASRLADLGVWVQNSTSPLSHAGCKTQPCIPPGSLNRVPALAGGKGRILTTAR